jgi:hypothetical protein
MLEALRQELDAQETSLASEGSQATLLRIGLRCKIQVPL